MRMYSRVMKGLYVVATGVVFAAGGGSCLPENFWSGVLSATIVDGLIAAARNTVLVALNLQTP